MVIVIIAMRRIADHVIYGVPGTAELAQANLTEDARGIEPELTGSRSVMHP